MNRLCKALERLKKTCGHFSKFRVPSSEFQVQPAAGAWRSRMRVLPWRSRCAGL